MGTEVLVASMFDAHFSAHRLIFTSSDVVFMSSLYLVVFGTQGDGHGFSSRGVTVHTRLVLSRLFHSSIGYLFVTWDFAYTT